MWNEIESRPWRDLKDEKIVVLPVGSFEQHGPLPLYTDTLIAYEVAKSIAREIGVPLLPPLFYGLSREHKDFPLTIYLSLSTYSNLMKEIFSSLQSHGIKLLVLVNGHGGNLDALRIIIGEWNYENPMKVFLVWPFECINIENEWHAGYAESSIVAYLLHKSFEGEGKLCEYMYPYFRTKECSETGSLYEGEFRSDPEMGKKLIENMRTCSTEKVKKFISYLKDVGVL